MREACVQLNTEDLCEHVAVLGEKSRDSWIPKLEFKSQAAVCEWKLSNFQPHLLLAESSGPCVWRWMVLIFLLSPFLAFFFR